MNSSSRIIVRKNMVKAFSLLLPLVLILAACAPAAATPVAVTEAPPPTEAPTMAPTEAVTPAPAITEAAATAAVTAAIPNTGSEATINVANDPTLGAILVDGKGMTLYMYAKDTPDKSNCSAGCLKAWPPLLTQGKPTLGTGVNASLVGTAATTDGRQMVTYNHMPLYYYVKDQKPGDVLGQNVGSVWFVVSPEGKVVGGALPGPATTAGPAVTAAPAATSAAGGSAGGMSLMVKDDAKLGKIIVDGNGMTLYMYAKDKADVSNCSAGCLKAWPPLLAGDSLPVAGPGLDAKLLGTTTLMDGRKVVTYNHWPLYYYVKDTKAGDVTGQNVGNVWFVLDPSGKPVGYTPPAM